MYSAPPNVKSIFLSKNNFIANSNILVTGNNMTYAALSKVVSNTLVYLNLTNDVSDSEIVKSVFLRTMVHLKP